MKSPILALNTQGQIDNCKDRQAVYQIASVLFSYPLPETLEALREWRLQSALNDAWLALTSQSWPQFTSTNELKDLEVGYMSTFIHGKRGKPRVPLVASAYESLVKGQTAGTFMLNIQAFYSHFGVKAAVENEGVIDEPDHLVSMLEFCVVLCHLEIEALHNDRDPSPYRRAHRDFLTRYLVPFLEAFHTRFTQESDYGLDPNIAHLIVSLPKWAHDQYVALETQVGPNIKQTSDSIAVADDAQAMWH